MNATIHKHTHTEYNHSVSYVN